MTAAAASLAPEGAGVEQQAVGAEAHAHAGRTIAVLAVLLLFVKCRILNDYYFSPLL
ncbi:hypothetical protein [Xylophilus sp. GOD-11R]|uniref:hypothetical protein n=1 Tax=Xylophilus sp. GOD-11R TaxID=3089814 RepID=UPI00298C2FB6|nr:hypothetical protein [Xylophilus sp. GOD-11R]WPB59204.1 hypothetical protein R9X41_11380 [Xylophilus sp. GOD-11R]